MGTMTEVLLVPARTVLSQIGQFLVNIVLVLIILLLGWVVSNVIKSVVTKVLKSVKLDDLSERLELDKLLDKGGITYTISELMGVTCYWISILVTFMVALESVGLTIAARLLDKVVFYIPNIIAAVFVLIVGMFVSVLLKNIVSVAANNAGLGQSKLLSKVVETIVIAFSVFIALEQLKIGLRITQLTLAIVLGSIGLGCALAFGLGCRDLAEKFVSDLSDKLKKK